MKKQSKESAYFIILKKLLKSQFTLTRSDFEQKRKKLTFDEVPQKKSRERVSHSSLILRLEELKIMEAIKEIKSGKRAKTGLSIPAYHLTFIGMIKLLQLCDEKKFNSDIFNNLRYLILIQYPPIKKMFSNKQIFETLVRIAKNTTIIVERGTENNESRFQELFELGFMQFMTASELLADKKDKIIYYIAIKRHYSNFSYVLRERIPVYRVRRENKTSLNIDAIVKMNKMVTYAFYDELIQRCNDLEDFPEKYIGKNGIVQLCGIIHRHPILKELFLDHSRKINDQFEIQKEQLTRVHSLIAD